MQRVTWLMVIKEIFMPKIDGDKNKKSKNFILSVQKPHYHITLFSLVSFFPRINENDFDWWNVVWVSISFGLCRCGNKKCSLRLNPTLTQDQLFNNGGVLKRWVFLIFKILKYPKYVIEFDPNISSFFYYLGIWMVC